MNSRLVLRARQAVVAGASLTALLVLACSQGDARTPHSDAPSTEVVARADSVASAHADRARQDSVNRAAPGYVVDSILSPAEELRRFQAGIAAKPESLSHGAASRDALVRKWAQALAAGDSITLIRLAVNRPEFAYLVYPESPLGRPPYRQPPATSWLQLSNASVQGFRRSLNAFSETPLAVISYLCAPAPKRQGANRVWGDCLVSHLRASGDTVVQRLFGAIIERDGRFKFLSLGSDL